MEELTELTEGRQGPGGSDRAPSPAAELAELKGRLAQERQIGRASCRERVFVTV